MLFSYFDQFLSKVIRCLCVWFTRPNKISSSKCIHFFSANDICYRISLGYWFWFYAVRFNSGFGACCLVCCVVSHCPEEVLLYFFFRVPFSLGWLFRLWIVVRCVCCFSFLYLVWIILTIVDSFISFYRQSLFRPRMVFVFCFRSFRLVYW